MLLDNNALTDIATVFKNTICYLLVNYYQLKHIKCMVKDDRALLLSAATGQGYSTVVQDNIFMGLMFREPLE